MTSAPVIVGEIKESVTRLKIRIPRLTQCLPQIVIFLLFTCFWGFIDVPIFMLISQALFIGVLGFHLLLHGHGKVRATAYMIWSLLWLSTCFLSIIWSKYTQSAITTCVAILQVILVNLLFSVTMDSKKKLNYVFDMFIAAGFILLVRLVLVTPIQDWGTGRFGMAIGMHVNSISINFLLSELFCVYKILTTSNRKRGPLYALLAIVFCAAIIATASKKTAIFMVLGPILMIMSKNRGLKGSIKGFCIILIALGVFLFVLQSFPTLFSVLSKRMEGFINLLTNSGVVDASTSERQYLMLTALNVFLENPLIGVGAGNYSHYNLVNTYAHSNPLELLANFGIVGTTIYYSLYVTIFIKLYRLRRHSIEAQLLLAIFACLCAMELICVVYTSEVIQIVIATLLINANLLEKQHRLYKAKQLSENRI